MQTAFLSWNSRIGGRPYPSAITSSVDRYAGPPVATDSGTAPPRQLTSGSDLNKTAEGPWLNIIDAGTITYDSGTAWRPSVLTNPRVVIYRGNYGSVSSVANFGFRGAAFGPGSVGIPSIGLLPMGPNAKRPTWNNLPKNTTYNLRVPNPSTTPMATNANREGTNKYSLSYNTGGVASLNPTGASQGEVLL